MKRQDHSTPLWLLRWPLAWLIVALSAGWTGQVRRAEAQGDAGTGAVVDPQPALIASEPSVDQLLVHLTLENSSLDASQILSALEEEFHMPVRRSESALGLQLRVRKNTLVASFESEQGDIVSREVALPEDPTHQVATIVLISGSLARDESGALIARLTAHLPLEDDAGAELDADAANVATPTPPAPAAPPATPAPSAAPQPTKTPTSKSPKQASLESVPLSIALVTKVAYPKHLSNKKVHAHLAVVSTTVGSVQGGAVSLFAHKNLGLDTNGAGQGTQIALAYLKSSGRFQGASISGLVANNRGDHKGAQVAGLVGIQRGAIQGTQISGLVSITSGNTQGAQLAMLGGIQYGNLDGAQIGGLFSYTKANLEGTQLGGLAAVSGGSVDGSQLSLLGNYAHQGLKGFQMSLSNVALKRMQGFQMGLINVAGDFKGTQLGLINIGGRGRGTQIALLNIAKDLKGAAIAPVNVIPGIRNQLLSYVSYFPSKGTEGTPKGPLYHLAVRFLPGPIYTQLGFGLGAESSECIEDSAAGSSCYGGGMVYAPSFALGVRSEFGKLLYLDVDAQYQFVKGFNQSTSAAHQALGRVALGVQAAKKFALFVGAGPRLDFAVGPRVSPSPELGFGWHAFGGIAAF